MGRGRVFGSCAPRAGAGGMGACGAEREGPRSLAWAPRSGRGSRPAVVGPVLTPHVRESCRGMRRNEGKGPEAIAASPLAVWPWEAAMYNKEVICLGTVIQHLKLSLPDLFPESPALGLAGGSWQRTADRARRCAGRRGWGAGAEAALSGRLRGCLSARPCGRRWILPCLDTH